LLKLADSRSIKFRIVALVVTIVAPLIVLFTLVTMDLAEANRATIELQRQSTTHDLSTSFDRKFLELRGVLNGIALSLASRTAINMQFDQPLAEKAKIAQIVDLWSFDAAANVKERFMDGDQSLLRPTLSGALVAQVFSGQSSVSLVNGVGFESATIIIAVPVFQNTNTVTSGLAAEIKVSYFAQVFKEAGMKDNWVAAVVDQEGRFIARSLDGNKRVGTLSRPEVIAIAKKQDWSGTFENVTMEGLSVVNSYLHSPITQWTSVVAVPKAELNAPLQRALAYMLIGGLGALALSLLAATIFAGRIARPIANLSRYATSLAEGKTIAPEKYKISEIETVRASLDQAMAKSARLAALVAASGDAIVSAGLDDKILDWNKGAENLFGYSAEDIIGINKSILVPKELMPVFKAQRAQILKGEVVRGETQYLKKNSTKVDVESVDAPIKNARGAITGYSTTIRDISERTAARDHRLLLMRELAHRTKNQLAVIQSIAKQTRRNATTVDSFVSAFNGRIQGLSASHDILSKQQWHAIPLNELVTSQISVLTDQLDRSVKITGPEVALSAVHAEALGLALHELTTNSIKYGALSKNTGRVAITWMIIHQDSSPHILFEWQESQGPKIRKIPTREGFGSKVLNRIAAISLGGKSQNEFRPEGFYWSVKWQLKT
jgi:PAS domain S-box-containing protein